jgi:hypothetical protein
MTKQGFFTTFSSGNPLLFYGTEELPEGEWFVYVNYVIFARPDDGEGKKAMDYVAGNETGVTREEGEEVGLLLIDNGSHADTLLSSGEGDDLFDLEDYSSALIHRVDLHQEGIQWEWRMTEGDQWVIEVTGDLGCIADHLDVDALQDFNGEFGFVGITVKTSGDDPPLFPIKLAGWDIAGVDKMSSEQMDNLC